MNNSAISFILLVCSLALLSATDAGRIVRAVDNTAYGSDGSLDSDVGPGYMDADLLGQLLASTRSKRQWCRRGMSYNHVTGRCLYSFAAMRARGRA